MLAKINTKHDLIKWAKIYKQCLSFSEVSRYFGINKSVVRRKLIKHRDILGIKLKEEIDNNLLGLGLKVCSKCFLDLGISEFNANRGECKICRRITDKQYRFNNRKSILAKKKNYYRENKDVILIKQQDCHKRRRSKRNEYERNKRKRDIHYRLSHNLRTRFKRAFKNNSKSGSAIRDLGCSIAELKLYLEKKFYYNLLTGEEMSWGNYGKKWQIDHITPLMFFDLTDQKQVIEATYYKNLQPLWADDHIIKTAKDKAMSL